MKRKPFCSVALLLVCVFAVFAFTACGNGKDNHTHAYTDTVVKATCTEGGYTLHKCSCGDEYRDSLTEALGHNYANNVCTECGSKELEFTLSKDETYYIVSKIGVVTATEFVIPTAYNGLPVKEIGEEAFKGSSKLVSIQIPDSVTTIGARAFQNCSSLTNIEIPYGVISIGDYAFYGCEALTSITIANSVTELGGRVFCWCTVLNEIVFLGTEDQWEAVVKGTNWNLYAGECALSFCPVSE